MASSTLCAEPSRCCGGSAGCSALLVATAAVVLLLASCGLTTVLGQQQGMLEFGFYSRMCPNAESIVQSVVFNAVQNNPTVAAALLRLHFHDCFVDGCDASILIQGQNAEVTAVTHQGLRGFDVIAEAKAQLENQCPGVVSCADIVALAARDAVASMHGPQYQVPTGRRDGLVSFINDAADMPEVSDSIDDLINKFSRKGLSTRDMVALTGSHTIGTTACFFLYGRLYSSPIPDPSINPMLLNQMLQTCPRGGNNAVRFPLDSGSDLSFDTDLFANIRQGFATLPTDAALYQNPSTRPLVDAYGGLPNPLAGNPSFQADFVDAIVRMGLVGVLTGNQGEIRMVCSNFNR